MKIHRMTYRNTDNIDLAIIVDALDHLSRGLERVYKMQRDSFLKQHIEDADLVISEIAHRAGYER